MMKSKIASFILLTVSWLPASASAKTFTATSATFNLILANVKDGDSIKLQGPFGSFALQNRTFATGLTIDASAATISGTLTIRNVNNLYLTGGKFNSTTNTMRGNRSIAVYGGSNISIMKATIVGKGDDLGITFAGTIKPTVTAVAFSGTSLGLGVTSVSDAKLSSNTFTKMTKDGINVVDSQRVLVTANKCSGTVPYVGAHPDCVQLWSLAGKPMQSDISITNNIISGATQGITSFDPSSASGTRITITGNDIYTSFSHGIACYGCFDSTISNNKLRTMADAKWQTTVNIIGGSNNIVSGNAVAALSRLSGTLSSSDRDAPIQPGPLARPDWLDTSLFTEPVPDLLLQDLALLAASGAEFQTHAEQSGTGLNRLAAFAANTSAAVPEPEIWMQMLTGFGLAGLAMRRRRTRLA